MKKLLTVLIIILAGCKGGGGGDSSEEKTYLIMGDSLPWQLTQSLIDSANYAGSIAVSHTRPGAPLQDIDYFLNRYRNITSKINIDVAFISFGLNDALDTSLIFDCDQFENQVIEFDSTLAADGVTTYWLLPHSAAYRRGYTENIDCIRRVIETHIENIVNLDNAEYNNTDLVHYTDDSVYTTGMRVFKIISE